MAKNKSNFHSKISTQKDSGGCTAINTYVSLLLLLGDYLKIIIFFFDKGAFINLRRLQQVNRTILRKLPASA